jgi:hypothetical protein
VRRSVTWVAAASVLVAALATGLAVALTRDGSAQKLNRAAAARAGGAIEGVPSTVTAFAPVVRLHPRERFFPTSPDEFLEHSKLVFFHAAGAPEVVADSPEATRLGDGSYRSGGFTTGELTRPYHNRPDRAHLGASEGFALDLADSSRCHGAAEGVGCVFDQAPVYYEYKPRRYVTYWLFYAYSAPMGFNGAPSFRFGHEGDWERVVVLLDDRDHSLGVAYYQHEGPPQIVAWSTASVPGAGPRRPVVFAALGTHASYPGPGSADVTLGDLRLGNNSIGPSATFQESRAAGTKWETWRDLRDVRAAWFGYGGAWGNRGRFPFTTGPLGPSRWKDPAPCTRRILPPCTAAPSPNTQIPFAPA